MTSIRTWFRLAGVAAAALSLSACVTVFPKTEPVQLYRFEGAVPASGEAAAQRVGLARAPGSFVAAAAGDRILSVTGSEVAYLAESRWAQPATTLFDEALIRAFNASTGRARLVTRGEPTRADYSLRLDVERFEANYDRGGKAAPEVSVDVHAVLVRAADRTVVGDEVFKIRVRSRENRVSAIIAAFDTAVGQALGKIVAWSNEKAG